MKIIKNLTTDKKANVYYTYRFSDGTVSKTMIPMELADEFKELERLENNSNQRAERREKSFMDDNNRILELVSPCVSVDVERRERYRELKNAIRQLQPDQQRLVMLIYYCEIPATVIAQQEGVSKSAISKRLGRIHDSLRKIILA